MALFNAVYLLQSYWYYKWYRNDDIDTRRNLVKGYKFVLIQSTCLYLFLFSIIYFLPASYLPDKYEDGVGNVYEFPKDKKDDMKDFALYFILLLGILNISVSFYLYRVVRRWAHTDNFL